jgi:archaellum biogenesis ATPase FlaH
MAIGYVFNPWAIISLISLIVNAGLGAMVLRKNPSGRLNRVYAIIAFSLSSWGFGDMMLRMVPESAVDSANYMAGVYYARLVWGFVMFAIFVIFHFILIILRSKSKLLKSKGFIATLYIAGIAYGLVGWFTPYVIRGVRWTWFGYTGDRAGTIGYTVFLVVYIILLLFLTVNGVKAFKASKSIIERSQLKLSLLGLVTVIVVGGIGQVLLPVIGKDIPIANLTALIMGLCFAFNMLKYNLFDIEAHLEDTGPVMEARQRLDPGFNYLVKEKGSRNSYEIFRGMVNTTPGLCFTTFHPQKLRSEFKLMKTPILWLTETETEEKTLSPSRLEFEILYTIETFIKDNEQTTILIDDVKYLAMCNGFENAMDFIKTVCDIASTNNSSVIIPVDGLLFTEMELHQLESAFDETIDTGIVPEGDPSKAQNIEKAYAYLCKSEKTDSFFSFIKNTDAPLLCLTSTFPGKVRTKHSLDSAEMLWLSTTQTEEKTLNPDRLDFEVAHTIGKFLREKNGVVAIEGLDLLIHQNGFQKVTEFLKGIIDIASESRGSLVANIDPKSHKEVEVALLEKRFDVVIQGSE